MTAIAAFIALGAAFAFGGPATTPIAASGASLFNLELKWTTQDGAIVALADFAGRPAIVADMMWIEKHLPPGAAEKVRFVFLSFDSEADTPERLKLYAESHGLNLDRWTLLRADDDAVRELAAALDVPFRPNDQNGFDHAVVISLLNDRGEIAFLQRGTQASSEALIDKLKELLSRTK